MEIALEERGVSNEGGERTIWARSQSGVKYAPIIEVQPRKVGVSGITLHRGVKGAEKENCVKHGLRDSAGHPVSDARSERVDQTIGVGSSNQLDGGSELGGYPVGTILVDTVLGGWGTQVKASPNLPEVLWHPGDSRRGRPGEQHWRHLNQRQGIT